MNNRILTNKLIVMVFAICLLFTGIVLTLPNMTKVYATDVGTWSWSTDGANYYDTDVLPTAKVGKDYYVSFNIDGFTFDFFEGHSFSVTYSSTGTHQSPDFFGGNNFFDNIFIDGKPTYAGTYTVIVQVNDTYQKTYTLVVEPVEWSYNNGQLPTALIGKDYWCQLTCGYCSPSYVELTYSLDGNLPPGLSRGLITSSYNITGTPTTAGVYQFIINCLDSSSVVETKTYTLNVVGSHTCNSITFNSMLNSSFTGGTLTSGNYFVADDLTLTSPITIASGETVNLCLNDRVINLNKFKIQNSGTLNIYDCGTTTRYFTDIKAVDTTNNNEISGQDGCYETYIGNTSQTQNAITVTGGVITGGWGNSDIDGSSSNGGAIINNSGATLTINGSHIVGNIAKNGGAIYNSGTMTQNGGCFVGNCAMTRGGGVYNNSTLTISNGNITTNRAKQGAGICNLSTFTMSEGNVSSNVATNIGAGIYTNNSSTTLLAGTISNNTITCAGTYVTNYYGAGVAFVSGSVVIGGTINVTNNLSNNIQDNVAIYNNNSTNYALTISTTTPLTTGANIGVRLANTSGTNKIFARDVSTDSYLQYFTSDVSSLAKKAEEILGTPVTYNYTLATPDCIISFDKNTPDSVTGTIPDSYGVFCGDTINLPTLTRTGYRHIGWATTDNATTGSFTYTIPNEASDTTLYAIWAQIFSIVYNGNNNTSGIVPTDTADYIQNDSVTLAGVGNLLRTNYKFLGWNTNSGAITALDEYSINSVNATSGVITLYAIWQEKLTNTIFGGLTNAGTLNNSVYSKYFDNIAVWHNLTATNGSVMVEYKLKNTNDAWTVLTNNTIINANEYCIRWYVNETDNYKSTIQTQVEVNILKLNICNVVFDYSISGQSTFSAVTKCYKDNINSKYDFPTNITITYKVDNIDNTSLTINSNKEGKYTVQAIPSDTTNYFASTIQTLDCYKVSFVEGIHSKVTNENGVLTDDGLNKENAYKDIFVFSDQYITTPLEPTISSTYYFIAWGISGSSNIYNNLSQNAITESIEYIAIWEEYKHVSYSANTNVSYTGTIPTDNNNYELGQSVTISNTKLSRSGYRQIGWALTNNATTALGTTWTMSNDYVVNNVVTLYAVWQQAYTITYIGNGNTSGTIPTDNNQYLLNENASISNGGNLAKTGYVLTCWNTLANNTGTVFELNATHTSTSSISDMTLYAIWTPVINAQPTQSNNYTVGTDAQDVTYQWYKTSGALPQAITNETTATIISVTENTGYYCEILNSNYNTKAVSNTITPQTISFSGNGATSGSINTMYQLYGRTITLPANDFTKTGYNFICWRMGNNDYNVGSSYTTINTNVTFEAVWELITYSSNIDITTNNIRYGATSNNIIITPTQNDIVISKIELQNEFDEIINSITNAGSYKLKLVLTNANVLPFKIGQVGQSTSETSYYSTLKINNNICTTETGNWDGIAFTLVANESDKNAISVICEFVVKAITIKYDVNAENVVGNIPSDETYCDGQPVTLAPIGNMAKMNYIFLGWNTDTQGESVLSNLTANSEDATNDTITLFAIWKEIPTHLVTYNSNGATSGTAPQNQSVRENNDITIQSKGDLLKSGYTFFGWSTGPNATEPLTTLTMGTTDITLYAIWQLNVDKVETQTAMQEGKPQVVMETENGFSQNITVEVEVVVETEVNKAIDDNKLTIDYYNLADDIKLKNDEKISVIYDVKLIRTINNIRQEIQPTDIDGVSTIKVKILLPTDIDISKITRILHVHSSTDIENITFDKSKVVNGYYELDVTKLSEFAFVCEQNNTCMTHWYLLGELLLLIIALIVINFVLNKKHKKLLTLIVCAIIAVAIVVTATYMSCSICYVFIGLNALALAVVLALTFIHNNKQIIIVNNDQNTLKKDKTKKQK